MKTSHSFIIVGLFLFWLIIPVGLYVTGFRTAQLEDTQTRDFPKVERTRVFDPTFYEGITTAATDRNPIKSFAIKTNARINDIVFRDATTRKVVQGEDDWLFIKESLHTPCVEFETIERRVNNLQALQKALEEKGKTVVFSVFPNKATVYPEKLTNAARSFSACTQTNRARLDANLRRSSVNYLNSFDLILDQKNMSSRQLYPETETHWNEHASAIFVEHFVDKIAPALATNKKHVLTQRDQMPDLSRMSGLYRPIQQDVVEFIRDGEQNIDREIVKNEGPGRDLIRGITHTTGAPLSDQRVLIVHDSFIYVLWDQIGQFFDEILYMHWTALTPETFEQVSADYDVIVFASVEREIYHRLGVHFENDGELKISLP